ncbi:hypothetical protein FBQ81_05915 [Chloroflexi bacterium CFX6]|nr:hypothetical protein [Chloroflexi bacterium CFX6]
MMSQDIYVVIEHLRGQVADISYTMLAAARELSQATSGKVVAVLLGHNAKDLAKDFAADQVLYLDHASLAEFTSDAYQKAWRGRGERAFDAPGFAFGEFLPQFHQ